MKHFLLLFVFSAAAVLAGAGYVRIGDPAPDFAKAQWLRDKSFSIASVKGKKMTAILFWKPDHSGAVGIQSFSRIAHKYRQRAVVFAAAGQGDFKTLGKFPMTRQLGAIPLIIDSEGKNKQLFLRPENRLPMAVLIGKDGKLLWRGNPARTGVIIDAVEKGRYDRKQITGDDDFNANFTGMVAKNDFKGALALLEKEILRPGVNPREIVSLQVGIHYRRLNSPENALEAIHRAQKKFAGDPGFYEMELKLLELANLEGKMGEFYYRLVAIFKNKPAVLMKFVTYEMNRPFSKMNPANIYTVARAAANAGKYSNKRERGKAMLYYAQSLYCLGRVDIAAQVAEGALKYLKGQKEYTQAREMSAFYRKVVEFSPRIIR